MSRSSLTGSVCTTVCNKSKLTVTEADTISLQQTVLDFTRQNFYIPSFTKGKNQLSAQEVEETRENATVRIHVERVIGLVRRKYLILQSIFPAQSW